MSEVITSNYPTSLDDTTSLLNDQVSLKSFVLNGDHSNSITTITTTSVITGFSAPNYFLIDGEIIHFTGISGVDFTGCTRGADGTSAASHSDADPIYHIATANWANQIRRAVIAIETELGTDPAGSLTDLKTRLAVSINDDGTLKSIPGMTLTGDLTFDGAYHPVIAPGSDTDAVLLEVTVTGTPQINWDESADNFAFSKGVRINPGVGGGNFKLYGDNEDGVRATFYANDPEIYAAFYGWDENDGGASAYAETKVGAISDDDALVINPVAGTATFGSNLVVTLANTALHILDTNASHDLIIAPGSDLTADRTLTLTTGDAARTVTLSGNPTLADWFDQSVKQAASPTFAQVTVGNTGLVVGASTPFSDSAGTLTLQNIDALDAATEATIEAAIDTLANLTSAASLATVGTIGTGTWEGTTIAVDQGGTGQTSYTDGQLLIGNTTGNTLAKATLTGTANQITVTNGSGSITLSTPQDIHTGASPTFAGLDLTEGNITNVGDISLDSLTSDGSTITIGGTPSIVLTDGTTVAVTLGNDAGDDFTIDTSAFVVEGDTGNVGIGTTSPGQKLEVAGTNSMLFMSGANSTLGFGETTTFLGRAGGTNYHITGSVEGDFAIRSASGKKLLLGNSTTLGMAISNGNVGIGTTAPATTLDIVHANSNAGGLRLGNSETDATTKTGRFKLRHYTNAEENVTLLLASSDASNNILNFGGSSGAENAASFIKFWTASNGTTVTGTQRMVIDNSGNVGIGTAAPDSKLHIDQASTTAAIPVMTLDQADLSEQFFRFMTTIGVGNPIEAVGAKTLTTTHFIRVEIDGVGDRYLPVGTIA